MRRRLYTPIIAPAITKAVMVLKKMEAFIVGVMGRIVRGIRGVINRAGGVCRRWFCSEGRGVSGQEEVNPGFLRPDIGTCLDDSMRVWEMQVSAANNRKTFFFCFGLVGVYRFFF